MLLYCIFVAIVLIIMLPLKYVIFIAVLLIIMLWLRYVNNSLRGFSIDIANHILDELPHEQEIYYLEKDEKNLILLKKNYL